MKEDLKDKIQNTCDSIIRKLMKKRTKQAVKRLKEEMMNQLVRL